MQNKNLQRFNMGLKKPEFYVYLFILNPLKKVQKIHAKKVINRLGMDNWSFLLLLPKLSAYNFIGQTFLHSFQQVHQFFCVL
jgi:hypothetical protein